MLSYGIRENSTKNDCSQSLLNFHMFSEKIFELQIISIQENIQAKLSSLYFLFRFSVTFIMYNHMRISAVSFCCFVKLSLEMKYYIQEQFDMILIISEYLGNYL